MRMRFSIGGSVSGTFPYSYIEAPELLSAVVMTAVMTARLR